MRVEYLDRDPVNGLTADALESTEAEPATRSPGPFRRARPAAIRRAIRASIRYQVEELRLHYGTIEPGI